MADFDLLREDIKDDIAEIKETQQAIYKILNGNGKIGLVTRVALLRASLTRMWAFIWLVIIGLLNITFFVIRQGLTQ